MLEVDTDKLKQFPVVAGEEPPAAEHASSAHSTIDPEWKPNEDHRRIAEAKGLGGGVIIVLRSKAKSDKDT